MTIVNMKYSYGIIPVRGDRVLLLQVYGQWDFPKGGPDPGEEFISTAIRELQEETNLSSPQFLWGNDFCESSPYKKGKKTARYFIASLPDGEVALLPNPATGIVEHHSFEWMSLTKALSLVPDRLKPVVEWASLRLNKEYGNKEEA
jgi:bis(5'-nucleosidyl)-tetraphosphatase